MTTTLGPGADSVGGSVVVLRLGDRHDEADLRDMASEDESGPAVVCLLAADVVVDPAVIERCRRLAEHRSVLLLRHPSVDPHLVDRDAPDVVDVVVAVGAAVDRVARTTGADVGLHELWIGHRPDDA